MKNIFVEITKSCTMPNKGELAKLLGLKSFDTAYPVQWANSVRDLGIDPSMNVFCYDEPTTFGKPIDLSQLTFEKMCKDLEEFSMKLYLLEQKAGIKIKDIEI